MVFEQDLRDDLWGAGVSKIQNPDTTHGFKYCFYLVFHQFSVPALRDIGMLFSSECSISYRIKAVLQFQGLAFSCQRIA